MALADHTILGRVRLRQARADPTVARLRLSRLLGSVSLQPPAMPPSAILMVRVMDDPLPGRISLECGPGARVNPDWERSAQHCLASFYATAARPLWSAPESSAAAVLFADYGELLACLALDLVSGSALGWWWQSILRPLSSRFPGAWATVWAEHPRYIPAALEHLDAQRQAVKVLQRIAPLQAWNLLMIVLRAFELPGLMLARDLDGNRKRAPAESSVIAVRSPSGPASGPGNAEANLTEQSAEGSTSAEAVGADSTARDQSPFPSLALRLPWEPYVSPASTPPELGYERQALLGLGLLLQRAPQAAFAGSFAPRFRAWIQSQESSHLSGAPPLSAVPSLRNHSALRARPTDQQHSAAEPVLAALSESSLQALTLPAHLPQSSAVHETTAQPVEERSGNHPLTVDVLSQDAGATPKHVWENGVQTRAGGVLYLIHLLQQSQILRHFDTGLGGWALLELLARCLLGDAEEVAQTLADDAIWEALATLDGRPDGTPPGANFRAQPAYTAPESWLAGLNPQERFVRYRSRGVELWNGEGFLLLDSEAGGPRCEGARMSASRRWRVNRLARVHPLWLSLSPQLRRFLHFLLPYARWRLRRALGATPLAGVLLRAGTLYLTSTHVDLVMSLKEITVPVRRAGLDANPGWVPELGRIVNFHFGAEVY